MASNFKPSSSLCNIQTEDGQNVCISDIILHQLIARIALTDGSTCELEARYFPHLKEIEIGTQSHILDLLDQVEKGPNLRRFINWFSRTDNIVTVIGDASLEEGTINLVDASSGPITVTLPDPIDVSQSIFVKKIDSSGNDVTVIGGNNSTIDGESSQIIAVQYVSLNVVSNRAEYFII